MAMGNLIPALDTIVASGKKGQEKRVEIITIEGGVGSR